MQSPTIAQIANIIRLRPDISAPDALPKPASAAPQYNPFANLKQVFAMPGLPLSQKMKRTFKIFRRVALRNGPVYGQAVLPYAPGARLLSAFCGNRLVQTLLFSQQCRLIHAFLSELPGSQTEAEVLRTSLASQIWKNWRLTALSRSTPQQFQTWVNIIGLDILQHAYQQGRGVILLSSHSALTQITRFVLARMKIVDFLSLGNNFYEIEDAELQRMAYHSKQEQRQAEMPKLIGQLYRGKKVLERGGVFGIAGDGYHGESGVTIPFHGRQRHFRAGFAELAVRTGATVIPVFISAQPAGHVQVAFDAPLKPGSSDSGHAERVESLIRQYAALLEQYWARAPGNVTWKFIERFLAAPRWEPSERTEKLFPYPLSFLKERGTQVCLFYDKYVIMY
jgi:lauroyl/myristoyl acyltransferase